MKYIAVGANTEDERVIVVLDSSVTVQLSEPAARKLADDLLQNANWLWPIVKQRHRILFPTMLRKMWSGSEVQEWLDNNINEEE